MIRMLLIPLLVATVFFGVAYGWHALDPHFLNWLMQGDAAIHFLGWGFFRNDPWQYPIGEYTSQLAPFGMNIVNADGNPIVSTMLKLILGPGAPIQFHGFWILSCYLLQALFGYKLLLQGTRDKIFAALGATFFILSPVLIHRQAHKALCAQWLILAAMYLYFRAQTTKKMPVFPFLGLNLLAVGIHIYFLPMMLMLTGATFWMIWLEDQRKKVLLKAATYLGIVLGSALAMMAAYGYFRIAKPSTEGFAIYSADLLALFNSQKHASIMPYIRFSGAQEEGFAYLGLGGIILFFTIAYQWRKKGAQAVRERLGSMLPLATICLIFAVYALSSNITIAGNPIIRIEWFYNLLKPIPDIMRSCGRFIWPLYYLLVYVLLLSAYLYFPRRKAFLLIGGLIVVQFIDMHEWYTNQTLRVPEQTAASQMLPSPYWDTLKEKGYRRMQLVPPAIYDRKAGCGLGSFDVNAVYALSLKALRNSMTINSAMQARPSHDQIKLLCDNFWREIAEDNLDGALYVVPVNSVYWAQFESTLKSRDGEFKCDEVDGVKVCTFSGGHALHSTVKSGDRIHYAAMAIPRRHDFPTRSRLIERQHL